MCSYLLCCWKRMFDVTSVLSWQNSFSFFPASFCTPRPNSLVVPVHLLTFCFCIPIPYDEKETLFLALILEGQIGLIGLHRTFNFSFFGLSAWGTDSDYCDVEWLALETNQDHSVLRLHPSTAFWALLLIPGEGHGKPLQYSCLESPMDGGAWWATVHGVAKSRTRLSGFTHSLTHSISSKGFLPTVVDIMAGPGIKPRSPALRQILYQLSH